MKRFMIKSTAPISESGLGSHTSMEITSLPPELIAFILEQLSFKDVLKCRQLSHFFEELIRNSAALQYTIELALAGMEDGPVSGPSSEISKARKRDMLRRYQHAQNTLKPDLVSEQELIIIDKENSRWILCEGIMTQFEGPRKLEFRKFPSVIRGIPGCNWEIDVDFDVGEVATDIHQGLLVALRPDEQSVHVHFLSVTTGQKHDLAAIESTEIRLPHIPLTVFHAEFQSELLISGPLVGIMVRDTEDDSLEYQFSLINWKLGTMEGWFAGRGAQSFAFLHDEYVIFASLMSMALALCVMVPPAEAQPKIRAIMFSLPSFSAENEVYLVSVELHCDPVSTWTPPFSSQSPFHQTKSDRLYVLKLVVHGEDQVFKEFRILVPSWTLLSHLENFLGLKASENPNDMTVIPWDKWGPDGARVLQGPFFPHMRSCSTFGTRYVAVEDGQVSIYDFNRYAVRQRIQSGAVVDGVDAEDGLGQLVDERTEIVSPVFQDPFYTSLPYLKYSTCVKIAPTEDAALSEDALIISSELEMGGDLRILCI